MADPESDPCPIGRVVYFRDLYEVVWLFCAGRLNSADVIFCSTGNRSAKY